MNTSIDAFLLEIFLTNCATIDPAESNLGRNQMVRNFLKNKRGNFILVFAMLAAPLTATIGMAIEYAYLTARLSKLQHAVDAAVLYAAKERKRTGEKPKLKDAKNFILANYDVSH